MKRPAIHVTGPTAADWKQVEVDIHSLAVLQEHVEGYIEHLRWPHGLQAYINEDGILLQLPPTARTPRYGPIVGKFLLFGELGDVEKHIRPWSDAQTHASAQEE